MRYRGVRVNFRGGFPNFISKKVCFKENVCFYSVNFYYIAPMNKFDDFGLLPSILRTLKTNRYTKPTEVQANIIPLMMSGQSVVAVSETGSGKTFSYVLPLLHKLKSIEDEGLSVTELGTPRAIVMVPTRELGEQVSKVFKTFTHETRLRVRPALGGMAMEQAKRNTEGPFEVLLATPGRLAQLLAADHLSLHDVRVLIFDEADQMLDQGFLEDSRAIYENCPGDIQLALFSGTISPSVQTLINEIFKNAEVFKSSGSGKVVKTLTTQNRIVKDGKRWPLLEKILKEPSQGGTILFTNTREQCDNLAKEMTERGFPVAIYRGEMDKIERRQNLKQFTNQKVQFLVATDLAGRGLDIPSVDRVINYHLPRQKENYLHRVGRTARAGRPGLVINLVTERDERLLAQIEGKPLPKGRNAEKYRSATPQKEDLKRPTSTKIRPSFKDTKSNPKLSLKNSKSKQKPSSMRPNSGRKPSPKPTFRTSR